MKMFVGLWGLSIGPGITSALEKRQINLVTQTTWEQDNPRV
jgi:hypothetical protein